MSPYPRSAIFKAQPLVFWFENKNAYNLISGKRLIKINYNLFIIVYGNLFVGENKFYFYIILHYIHN